MTSEPIHLKQAGARWFHSHDHHSPNLSKTSLGEFFTVVLSAGAYIGEIWPFNHRFYRSAVYVSVFMTEETPFLRKSYDRFIRKGWLEFQGDGQDRQFRWTEAGRAALEGGKTIERNER